MTASKPIIVVFISLQEEIRCLNSHNSELRSQLEVLSSRTRDSSETPDLQNDDSADTTTPPQGQTPSISDSPRPPPSPSPSTSASESASASVLTVSSANASPNPTPVQQVGLLSPIIIVFICSTYRILFMNPNPFQILI